MRSNELFANQFLMFVADNNTSSSISASRVKISDKISRCKGLLSSFCLCVHLPHQLDD